MEVRLLEWHLVANTVERCHTYVASKRLEPIFMLFKLGLDL